MHFISMQKTRSTFTPFLRNLDINNHPHPSRRTTPPQRGSSTAKSNPNAPRPWICASIGNGTERHKNSSDLLESGHTQLRRLLDQTPSGGPSPKCPSRIPHLTHSTRATQRDPGMQISREGVLNQLCHNSGSHSIVPWEREMHPRCAGTLSV